MSVRFLLPQFSYISLEAQALRVPGKSWLPLAIRIRLVCRYLNIRMLRNPTLYGVPLGQIDADPLLKVRAQELLMAHSSRQHW